LNILWQNYDYLPQGGRHQAALADFAAWMPHHWPLRLGEPAVSVYVVGQASPTNLTFGPS